MKDAQNPAKPDLLYGAAAISAHLGMTPKQVYHLHDSGGLPTFKTGAIVCARRSTLARHFAAQEAAAGAAMRHG